MADYVTRIGARRRRTAGRGLYDQRSYARPDDGRIILHAGDLTPTCPDCGVGKLLWAEAGYVAWHRICSHCGSHWDLHPRSYYVTSDGELLTTGPDGVLAPPLGPTSREPGAPLHAELLALVTIGHIEAALRQLDPQQPAVVGEIPTCWARRARFYRGR